MYSCYICLHHELKRDLKYFKGNFYYVAYFQKKRSKLKIFLVLLLNSLLFCLIKLLIDSGAFLVKFDK